MTTRLTPSEPFPEDLSSLSLPQVEVLNSKIQRELSHEYVQDGLPDPETEFRNEELTEELDRRDAAAGAESAEHPSQQSAPVLNAARRL
ncbi:hypothetical protein C4K88_11520 [Arthrobacter pityocampae]|uniref:Uncharacterized protein n=1 Tax=Arthrobacter pityocampae TaxID=547334 RepID=A0A2S5IV11_9MICC|nr:hypothetical protein [Arthrobacter pityocampae]PPB48381.1 hypothetical protein C4K88_11520 [Arthrobacter pityocampae]